MGNTITAVFSQNRPISLQASCIRIDILKAGLLGIAKRYGFQDVQDFYWTYNKALNAYADWGLVTIQPIFIEYADVFCYNNFGIFAS